MKCECSIGGSTPEVPRCHSRDCPAEATTSFGIPGIHRFLCDECAQTYLDYEGWMGEMTVEALK